MRTSERGKNHNKSNIQRVDSVLRAKSSFRAGGGALLRTEKGCEPSKRSVLRRGQRLAGYTV